MPLTPSEIRAYRLGERHKEADEDSDNPYDPDFEQAEWKQYRDGYKEASVLSSEPCGMELSKDWDVKRSLREE